MEATSDYALAQRAASGDMDARDQLLSRHYGAIERLCRRMCSDQASVDDVVQETCIAMLRGLGRYRGEASFTTWLYTLARTHRGRVLRSDQRHRARADRLHLHLSTTAAPTVWDAFAWSQRWSEVERALGELPPVDRTVFELRELHGYSAAETSHATGLTVPAVKTRLHRARCRIRTRLVPSSTEAHAV